MGSHSSAFLMDLGEFGILFVLISANLVGFGWIWGSYLGLFWLILLDLDGFGVLFGLIWAYFVIRASLGAYLGAYSSLFAPKKKCFWLAT